MTVLLHSRCRSCKTRESSQILLDTGNGVTLVTSRYLSYLRHWVGHWIVRNQITHSHAGHIHRLRFQACFATTLGFSLQCKPRKENIVMIRTLRTLRTRFKDTATHPFAWRLFRRRSFILVICFRGGFLCVLSSFSLLCRRRSWRFLCCCLAILSTKNLDQNIKFFTPSLQGCSDELW